MKKNENVKILVATHKPFKTSRNDKYVPIHCGRSIAQQKAMDGQINKKQYEWMLEHTIGDDTGMNISYKNREFNELTAIYWAWKNYEKLKNPDYIGLMHYRRHFKLRKLDTVKNYDIILSKKFDETKAGLYTTYNHYKQDRTFHHIEDYDKALDIIRKKYPEYNNAIERYNKSHYFYPCNMFIMKKEVFFDYCNWLFDVLLQAEKEIDISNYNMQEKRAIARIGEWMLGIYYTHYLETHKSPKSIELPVKNVHCENFFQRLYKIYRDLKPILIN